MFLFSDEDEEEEEALLYLPVSPEIEEPEEALQGEGAVSLCCLSSTQLPSC